RKEYGETRAKRARKTAGSCPFRLNRAEGTINVELKHVRQRLRRYQHVSCPAVRFTTACQGVVMGKSVAAANPHRRRVRPYLEFLEGRTVMSGLDMVFTQPLPPPPDDTVPVLIADFAPVSDKTAPAFAPLRLA